MESKVAMVRLDELEAQLSMEDSDGSLGAVCSTLQHPTAL